MPEQKNDFTQGSIVRAVLNMAIPMTAAQLMNVLYNLVDRIFVGHIPGEGTLALTGLGIALPITSLIVAFANLAGMGGGPLCSIERGKGNLQESERYMGASLALLLLFAAVCFTGVMLFRRPLLYLFGASDTTYPYANAYLSIYLFGTVFVMLELGMNNFINAQGFGRVSMFTVTIGAVLNLVLDPVFIFLLDMGLKGAAVATVISQAVSAFFVMKFLLSPKSILKLRLRYLRFDRRLTGRILALGMSGFVMSFTNSLVQIVCNATALRYGGDLCVGVLTILFAVREVIMMVVRGITDGSEPVLGYNYGAGRPDRVCGAIRFIAAISIIYSAAVWLLLELFPAPIVSLFTDDADLIAMAVPSMRIYYMGFIFMALQFTAQATFVGLDRSKNAITFSLLRKVVIVVPLTLLLPLAFGVNGIFLAEPISDLIGGSAAFLTMLFTVYFPLRREAKSHSF